jgi:2'-5' RNA ligase
MRLFLAIELPAVVKDALADIAHPPLADLKWTATEQLHITMKFLGEVPDDQVPALVEAMRRVPKPGELPLQIAGVVMFPPRGPIRIVGAEVADDTGGLAKLAADLEDAAATLRFPREKRPFHAHVTLARARQPIRRDRVMVTIPELPFVASEFVLMQSTLSPQGSTYAVAARFPL